MRVDLNADLGESYGRWSLGDDEALLAVVTSANIACGFHAGDPLTIRQTVRRAAAAGVAVGAHPSYPDLAGFGRREMAIDPDEIEAIVLYQVSALQGMAAAEGVRLAHVKPHGALYNASARDRRIADAIARAVRRLDAGLALVGLAGSCSTAAAETLGLRAVREGFADRSYLADGSLAPRSLAGSVVADPDLVAARAVRLVRGEGVEALDTGAVVCVAIDTLCVHGDTPGAPALARRVREALEAAGATVAAAGSH